MTERYSKTHPTTTVKESKSAEVTEEQKVAGQQAYYSTYIAHRTKLNELAIDQIRSLDKAVMTISSGAMGVSVAFLDKITSHDSVMAPTWLMLSWGCFTFAILTTAVSFWTSHQSLQQQIVLFDQFYREGKADEKQELYWRWLTRGLGIAAIFGMCAGIGCMGTFVYLNFPQEAMIDEQRQSSEAGSI